MTSLLQKDHKFAWTKGCEVAFRTLRKILTTAPVLAQPDIEKPFDVFSDASKSGLVIGYQYESVRGWLDLHDSRSKEQG